MFYEKTFNWQYLTVNLIMPNCWDILSRWYLIFIFKWINVFKKLVKQPDFQFKVSNQLFICSDPDRPFSKWSRNISNENVMREVFILEMNLCIPKTYIFQKTFFYLATVPIGFLYFVLFVLSFMSTDSNFSLRYSRSYSV